MCKNSINGAGVWQDRAVNAFLSAQLAEIEKAANRLDPNEVATYRYLRALLQRDDADARQIFEKMFIAYYGLNSGGITDKFREAYFDRLYELRGKPIDDACYDRLLWELYEIPRHEGKKGRKSLQFSFVSKLVSILDESRPLFDTNVRRFFGLDVPQSDSPDLRIAGFVSNLVLLKTNYEAWLKDARFERILGNACDRIPELRNCHPIRACDFFVWQARRLYQE
ncbi:MAG: hypothetical protein K6U10_05785 [Acidobacteriia bacterium]|nr:hypothetical protein [Methyloceanibacter sp.]MBX5470935.1 hypothetical protein [Acetobacteraceae bacterium]MCL6491317.1 hypothetical protein [Terriglobia bacterium]